MYLQKFSKYLIYLILRIEVATFSKSHFGVEVAPHTPTRSSSRNHSFLISSTEPIWYVLIFRDLHSSHKTRPLELSLPDTKMITSWFIAKSDNSAWRDATCAQIVL
jgi:hypothetical protein